MMSTHRYSHFIYYPKEQVNLRVSSETLYVMLMMVNGGKSEEKHVFFADDSYNVLHVPLHHECIFKETF